MTLLKLSILAAALCFAAPAAAGAASDGTSNTIMFAEAVHKTPKFIDYTDDAFQGGCNACGNHDRD